MQIPVATRLICAGPRRSVAACAHKSDFPRFTSVLQYLDYDGVTSVSVPEAKAMVDKGDWVLVDVRPMTRKAYKIDGAIEVPIFEVVDMIVFGDLSTRTKMKAVAHTLNGVAPMEINKDFAAQVVKAADGLGVILMCEDGGSIDPLALKDSRSIKAAWKLTTANPGYPTAHLKGGTAAMRVSGEEEKN
jgi:rhodanese-related sulfurtransferase